jgi:sigma-B regulation protein RsbU (phosphoserine phosphatase)
LHKETLEGFIGLSKKVTGFKYSYEDMTVLNVLANQLIVAMENARLYAVSLEKKRLEEELAVARQIQSGLLPKSYPQGLTYEFAAFCQPSREVGGDYYDFLDIDGSSIGIVIADVSGKGIPAALLVSSLHAALRAEVRNKFSPPRVMSNINQLIAASTSPEKFATMFYGEFYPGENKLSYCNAGHNYPAVIHADGQIEFLIAGGLVLGAFPQADYEKGELILQNGDLVVFYSDGVTEAFNEKEEEFGENRLFELLLQNRHLSAEKIKQIIVDEVERFSGSVSGYDDFTLVIMKLY